MTDLLRDHTAKRVAICVLLAVVAGNYAYRAEFTRDHAADIGQVWFAARAVLHGQNPYPLIGPGRAFEWMNGFYYPLPAALLLIPLAPFSQPVAVALFAALGGFVLAWALTEHGYGPLWGFASLCGVFVFEVCQWSPLFAVAFVFAPLGIVLVAKPTIGAAIFAAKPSRWPIVGGLALLALAFVLQPHWVDAWRESLHETSTGGGPIPYTAPVFYPGGFLVLLALLRWKRPEARLLAVLACVPQTTLPYEAILLFLVVRGWKQGLGLAVSSWVMRWYVLRVFDDIHPGLPAFIVAYGHAMVPFLYLPATIMVLVRPNEGTLPAWLWSWVPALRGSGGIVAARSESTTDTSSSGI